MDRDPVDWHIVMVGRTHQIQLLDLIDLVQSNITRFIRDIVTRRETEAHEWLLSAIPPENLAPVEELEAYRESKIEKNVEEMPATLYSALFASSYHFFEHDLNELCRIMERENGLSSYNDWRRDRGIHRAKSYLRREGGINFPSGGSDWELIVSYGKLRNLIAHNGARLDGSAQAAAIEPFVRGRTDLSVNQDGDILFTRDFASSAADHLRDFWLELAFVFSPEKYE